ncbi:MAG: YbaN family protein [Pirellulales bacterium]|nr:YbaN family protein [Pirellulales bacterium]
MGQKAELLEKSFAAGAEQPAAGDSMQCVKRMVFLALAGVFFVLGMIGIVLPGLPTTPLLLLTSYFLVRSSPRMHQMLLDSRLFGPPLRHWQQHRTVQPRTKLQAGLLVCAAMAMLLAFSKLPPALLAAVLALAVVGLVVIYRLPTSS